MKLKNPRVFAYSIAALGFMLLTFAIDWLFIVPAVILSALSQKELFKKQANNKK